MRTSEALLYIFVVILQLSLLSFAFIFQVLINDRDLVASTTTSFKSFVRCGMLVGVRWSGSAINDYWLTHVMDPCNLAHPVNSYAADQQDLTCINQHASARSNSSTSEAAFFSNIGHVHLIRLVFMRHFNQILGSKYKLHLLRHHISSSILVSLIHWHSELSWVSLISSFRDTQGIVTRRGKSNWPTLNPYRYLEAPNTVILGLDWLELWTRACIVP
jgi:hypothetical protein